MWITKQRWKHLYFAHFAGPADLLRRVLPPELELDLWQGEAVLSVVPFHMSRVRFPFLPPIPMVSTLWEYNLRTYVRRKGRPGIYFFTLESDHPLANWVARSFFGLPYQTSSLRVRNLNTSLELEQKRDGLFSKMLMRREGGPPQSAAFERWATERYCLFNVWKGRVVRGDVEHVPWQLEAARLHQWEGNFLDLVPGARQGFRYLSGSYSECLDVTFSPFDRDV